MRGDDAAEPLARGLRRAARRALADHLGAFAVTAGLGADELVDAFEAEHDDYRAIMVKALADRLAEAFAEYLHAARRARVGLRRDRAAPNDDLIAEQYRGIRPAFGYPACPDHTEKRKLFDLLGAARARHRADRELRDDARRRASAASTSRTRRRATSTSAASARTRSRTTRAASARARRKPSAGSARTSPTTRSRAPPRRPPRRSALGAGVASTTWHRSRRDHHEA